MVKNSKLRKYLEGKVILIGDEPILILFEGRRKGNINLVTKSLEHSKSLVRPYTLLRIKRFQASTRLFYHDIYPRVIWRFFNKTAGYRAKAKRSDQLLWFTFLLFYVFRFQQASDHWKLHSTWFKQKFDTIYTVYKVLPNFGKFCSNSIQISILLSLFIQLESKFSQNLVSLNAIWIQWTYSIKSSRQKMSRLTTLDK